MKYGTLGLVRWYCRDSAGKDLNRIIGAIINKHEYSFEKFEAILEV
jgi:hypothetical protein